MRGLFNMADLTLLVLDSVAIEKDWGRVFSIKTANVWIRVIFDISAGNAPYIVNRHRGEIVVTGSAHDIGHYIDEYESTL